MSCLQQCGNALDNIKLAKYETFMWFSFSKITVHVTTPHRIAESSNAKIWSEGSLLPWIEILFRKTTIFPFACLSSVIPNINDHVLSMQKVFLTVSTCGTFIQYQNRNVYFQTKNMCRKLLYVICNAKHVLHNTTAAGMSPHLLCVPHSYSVGHMVQSASWH